jgi:hypothetical protein
MIQMHYFYVLPKLLQKGWVGCLCSPSCREGVFSETRCERLHAMCVTLQTCTYPKLDDRLILRADRV